MIPYGRQTITDADIAAVTEVLRSDFLTQGDRVPAFEKTLTEWTGANHAVAVNSATSALHIACMALDLGQGDLLWTTPISFVASSNCALYCGAQVDFVDIDPDTCNMSVAALRQKLETARQEDRLPKIVVPVHLTGQVCEMAEIGALAREFGFRVIEDASHAIGGSYAGEPVGNCRHSDITVFSFHPVKIVTTAEGGAAMTNDVELAQKMQLFRSHGVTRDPELMVGESDGPWYYQQVALGYNYRMTDLQGALGVSQMDQLANSIARRHAIAARYDAAFADLPLAIPRQHPDQHSGYHLYVIRVTEDHPLDRATAFGRLREAGLGVNVHYIPIHLQPYYRAMGFEPGDFPEAERYYSQAISLPMFPALTDADQDRVIDAVRALS